MHEKKVMNRIKNNNENVYNLSGRKRLSNNTDMNSFNGGNDILLQPMRKRQRKVMLIFHILYLFIY